MSATAIGDFYTAVEEFAQICRAIGSAFEGPALSREELSGAWGSLDGLDMEQLLDATISATGYGCDSQLGDAPLSSVAGLTGGSVTEVEDSYRGERMRAAALVDGAARCGTAVEDVTETSSTSISECLGAGRDLLTMFCAMMSMSMDREFSHSVADAGTELIDACIEYSETEIAGRDECVTGAFEQFAHECECHCQAEPAPEPAQVKPEQPEPAEPAGIKPPPPELAEVPEPSPPPKKMQNTVNEAGGW